eukprot:CAMPEP_0194301486 /NCGR_PEP_ID=MMETSP0169-20130528/61820_1 /TAXON_ID=218684 /ORGANISM="Corethron pennatum, Strain L29A3" /LENGTH=795 /DNA_ID=CAMNT_0039051737 /DNA_START=52 /DNA_END=2436 /DNA_ORIENTATION=+
MRISLQLSDLLLVSTIPRCLSTIYRPILPTPITDIIHDPGMIIIGPGDIIYPCPMRSMIVSGIIVDGIVQVTLEQEFETSSWNLNKTSSSYQLPMAESAAVTEFRATVGDRVIRAVVKEKSVAREEFNEAVNAGQSAYLAEQTRADIFKISVGNLPSNQVVKVSLVYITTLEFVGANTVKFVFPTAISPRYDPRPEKNTEEMIDLLPSLINEGVKINLSSTSASAYKKISSSTHDIEVSGDLETGKAKINITDSEPLKRDVVILLRTKRDRQPKLFLEKSNSDSSIAAMLSFVPHFKSADVQQNSEFIFIVDQSGSMDGQKISQTRTALEKILSILPTDSLFNIVGFGSTFSFLFDESQPKSSLAAMAKASLHVSNMQADYGGTEILAPLRKVLNSNQIVGFDRQVIVMTDGQVSNTAETIKFVRKFRSNTRIFSLGIGAHVSRLLVQGLARSGRGTAEFVDGDSDQDVFDAVERQMNVASTPALDDLELIWQGFALSNIEQTPFATPPLVLNKRFLMYFFLESEASPTGVKITARNYATDLALEYNINIEKDSIFLSLTAPEIIHKMAARTMIRDLEEGGSRFSLNQINKAEFEVQNQINEEIVRLGVKYQIASSQTSFIAVDNTNWSEIASEKTQDDASFASFASPPQLQSLSSQSVFTNNKQQMSLKAQKRPRRTASPTKNAAPSSAPSSSPEKKERTAHRISNSGKNPRRRTRQVEFSLDDEVRSTEFNSEKVDSNSVSFVENDVVGNVFEPNPYMLDADNSGSRLNYQFPASLFIYVLVAFFATLGFCVW